MSLRGTNPGHVLLLVDGIPLGSATAGTPAWEYLPLAQAERIEVVRGPRSSLYGSSAIGGIVQMFMPRGEGPAHAEVSALAGSLDTYDVRASVAGAAGDTHYYLGGGHLYTAGINATKPSPSNFWINEPDTDGYRNSSFGLRLGHRFGSAELDVHLLRAAGHSEFDGTPNAEDFLQQVAGVDFAFSPLTPWQARLTVGESRDERDSVPAGVASYRFHIHRVYTAWQNNLALAADHLLTVGVDHQDEHVDSNTAFTVTSRADTSVFLEHQATFGRHDLIAGVRYDDNEAFGGHTTGNLAYGLRLTPGLRLTAAWGSAFKAPTFSDLYYPTQEFGGVVFFRANPNLRPETAHAYEVGLMGTPVWGSWELRAFRTDLDDLITFDVARATMVNLQRARIDGVEASTTAHLAGWELGAALSVLDPRDRDTDQILPRRTRHTTQLSVARQFGPLHSALTVLRQGGRYDDVANTVHLPGYTLVNLRLGYALDHAWTLEGRVDNLFDADYETVAGYNSLGRTVLVGVRYAPH
jgi:vitamin B12 transporter